MLVMFEIASLKISENSFAVLLTYTHALSLVAPPLVHGHVLGSAAPLHFFFLQVETPKILEARVKPTHQDFNPSSIEQLCH